VQIDWDGSQWVAIIPFEQRQVVKDSGFTWDPEARKWVTRSLRCVEPVRDFATKRARTAILAAEEQESTALKLSRALHTTQRFKCPPGLAYMPFQEAGIEYALERPFVMIADPPGLGKTIQAVGVVNNSPNCRRILIVCPASLKINWSREFDTWKTDSSLTVGIVTTVKWNEPYKVEIDGKLKTKYLAHTDDVFPDTDVVIVNHELLKRHLERLRDEQWDLIVVDESHYLTNPEADRTLNILGGTKGKGKKKVKVPRLKTTRFLMLSGTPMLSRPRELWPMIKAADPKGWGRNYLTYAYRFCGAYTAAFGLDDTGSSNLPELQAYLRKTFMIRRPKMEALKDLPPKRRQIIELPSNGLQRQLEAEQASFSQNLKEFEALARGTDLPPPEEKTWTNLAEEIERRFGEISRLDYEDRARFLRTPENIAFEEISTARKELAIAKLPMVSEHLTNLMASGEKIICFVYHTEVAEALRQLFPGCAYITGKVASGKRQAEVDRFREDPECQLMIGNINAAGVGHTMTASSIVVFAELAWTPAEMSQAEDRAWRHGQKNAVLVQHLVVEDSLDSRMVTVLIEKQKDLDAALDDVAMLPDFAVN